MPNANDQVLRDSYQIVRKGHQDPPEEEWPGEPVTEEHVELASGHALDLLSRDERIETYRQIDALFHERYENRRIAAQWIFQLLLGVMGSGKTTLAVVIAALAHCKGWPVFHTGSLLFGRTLAANEVYRAVNSIPDNSIYFIDEAHVFMGLASDNSRHAMLLLQSVAGLRKKNCRFILATAADDLMSRKLKREAHEVLAPFKPALYNTRGTKNIRDLRRRRLGLEPLHGAPEKSELFRMGYDTIENYPFAEDGILERMGLAPSHEDPDTHTIRRRMIEPAVVKEALLLNDSFQQVPVGVQMTVHRQSIVDDQADALYGGRQQVSYGEGLEELDDWQVALFKAGQAMEALNLTGKARVRARDIVAWGGVPGISATQMGEHIRTELGVMPNQNGFVGLELMAAINGAFGGTDG